MIEIKTIYDALKIFESADTWDVTYDDGICWDLQDDDDDDLCAKCATEIAKRIDIVKINKVSYGVEFVADIGKFVKEHFDFLYKYSQGCTYPMPVNNPNDDDSIYRGVQIVNAMQAGYACDEDYEAMLKEMGVE